MHIQISLCTKSRLKLTLLNFWIKLTQKGFFRTKKIHENYLRILHIQINLDFKFQLQQAILIFGQISKKKYTFGRKQKKKKMNIAIEFFIFKLIYLNTNFQLKLTIATIWTKFPQER